jgi:hypothetical protein
MAILSRRSSVLLVTIGAVLATFSSRADTPWRLLTPDEEARDNATPEGPVPPDLPPPPAIDLVRPDVSGTVRNPVSIEVRLRASSGETIDMRTLQRDLWAARNQHHRAAARARCHDADRPLGRQCRTTVRQSQGDAVGRRHVRQEGIADVPVLRGEIAALACRRYAFGVIETTRTWLLMAVRLSPTVTRDSCSRPACVVTL